MVFLTIYGLIGVVYAFTPEEPNPPNGIAGIITINGSVGPAGTNYTVTVISGTNVGYTYYGGVDDVFVPEFLQGDGFYDTQDQLYFNTNDIFNVTVRGFSQNVTGTFGSFGQNGDLSLMTNLVNLSLFYPENLPPTTTFNSSSTNITSINGWYNNSVNVTLFVTDNPRPIASGVLATYHIINGTGQQSGSNFILASQGNNTIAYFSVDNNGSIESTQTTYMKIDRNPPSMNISSPSGTTSSRPTVSVQLSDLVAGVNEVSGINVSSVRILINNSEDVTSSATITNTTVSYTRTAPLPAGTNNVTIIVRDYANNSNTTTQSFIVDLAPPVITNVANATPTSNSVNITWTTNELADGIVKYGPTTGLGSSVSNATLGFAHFVTVSGLTLNTTYYYVVNSTDVYGNTNETITQRSFTTRDAPTVIITSPSDTTHNTSTVSLNSSFSGQTVSYAWYKLDSNANSTSIQNTAYLNQTLSSLSDGQHNITVYANDSEGALGRSTRHFVVDASGPVFTGVMNSTPTSGTVTISWTTNENATTLLKYGTIAGNLNQVSSNSELNTSHSVSITGLLANTTYYYAVNGTDAYGNSNQSSVAQFTTRAAPTVSITSPANASTRITTPDLNASFTDTVSYAWYNIDGGANSTPLQIVQFLNVTLSPLSEGNHYVTVYANDSASTVGQSTRYFTVDTTAPILSSITNLTPTSVSVTITWTTEENATSIVKYNTSSGNLDHYSSSSNLTTEHSISLTVLQPNTTYYYVVNSTDAAGNSNQSAENNFITAAAPTVFISSPLNTTYNTPVISLNASFGGQNVSYAWYQRDGGTNSTASTNVVSLNATLSGLSEGVHNVTVYANDSAGYMGQSTVNFTVDTTGPVISSVSSTNTNSNSSTITWTTDEAATSVVKYGISSTNLDMNVSNISRVTSHSLNLTGLVQNTTYYYAVNSTDAVGNSNQSSPVSQFTTSEVYGSVDGTIIDARFGTTIANVTVTLNNASGGTYTTTTESNGAYTINNIITNIRNPYIYTISASKNNYTTNSSLSVTVLNSTTSNTTNITLRAYNGTFRGTVIKNGTSIGIDHASVNITNSTLGSVIVMTDASGSYSASVYPASYDSIKVSKAGYLNWTLNNENVISNETHTVTTVSLSSNTVTVTADRTVGSADSGQNVSFNLTVANTGDDATFSVTTSVTDASTIVTNTTTPSPLLLNTDNSTGYVVVEVNNSNPGGFPVTITISNSSQSKSASITLNAIMRNASANYTNISSTVDTSSSVNGATLVNATIQNNATISGNSTLIMNATVTGSGTVITDGAVIRGDYGNSNIDNSSVGNATVVSSNLTGSTTVRSNSTVTNSTLEGATVDNSTLTNVTVRSDSIITNVASLSNITLGGVTVTGASDYEYEGRITGGNGWATYQGINFTRIYYNIRISQLVIEQGPDMNVGTGTNVSIDDTSLGTSMNFSMIVNLSNPALINVSETGISPDGAGFSSGTRIGNFLVIRSNDTNNVTTHILRLYLDTDPSTYTGGVAIYYYNTSAAPPAWQALTTTGSGTEGGRYYIEARPDHFSTFALLGTTTTTTTTTSSSGGSSGSGGGGLVTSEPYDNIAKSERYDKSLIANKSVTYTFKAPELGIYEIAITGKENENDIALRVEVLKGTSKLVSVQAPGIVYKNVNVWAGSKKIKEAVIGFIILNSWFTENGIDASEIKLVKWDGNNWVQLETLQKKKDTTYVYYEAKIDIFSHFAITGIKAGVSTQTMVSPTPSEATKPVSVPTGVPTEVPVEKKSNGFEAIYLFVGILAVAYMLRRK